MLLTLGNMCIYEGYQLLKYVAGHILLSMVYSDYSD